MEKLATEGEQRASTDTSNAVKPHLEMLIDRTDFTDAPAVLIDSYDQVSFSPLKFELQCHCRDVFRPVVCSESHMARMEVPFSKAAMLNLALSISTSWRPTGSRYISNRECQSRKAI